MPIVPEYTPNVQARPNYRNELAAVATPEAFGAAIGRGMQGLASGIGDVGKAMAALKDLEDEASVKEREKQLLDWKREAAYGEGGFMTLEGKAAVEARSAFEKSFEEKRREFGQGLAPNAARMYQKVTDAHRQSAFDQSAVHTANARKQWINQASNDRVTMFANEALVSYSNPDLVNKNIAAGLAELQSKAELGGWDADTLKQKAQEYVSGVHYNVAMRLAQDDPLRADAYISQNKDKLTGAHQFELKAKLDTEVKTAKSLREAEKILTKTRGSLAPEAEKGQAGEVAGEKAVRAAGPTKARAFLQSVSNKDASHIDGLEDVFATNLASMVQDAPFEGLGIYSGYRSPERQEQLFREAVKKYGSEQAARRWVAPPGRSNHNHGKAVDLSYKGQSLARAPENVKRWVRENASKYGLHVPMDHEPWHIEPLGTRGTKAASGGGGGATVVAKSNTVSYRAAMPSYAEIEAQLQQISDPEVRDLTRRRINAQMEAQSKAIEQQERLAKAELWSYIDQGMTPDDVPMEVRQAAGMSAVSAAWGYVETAAKGRAVETDEVLFYHMSRFAEESPSEFAEIDLTDLYDRLSKADRRALADKQAKILGDTRKDKSEPIKLTEAMSQADKMLEMAGITTAGIKDEKELEAMRLRQARFMNQFTRELEAFKEQNGTNPTQMDIQSILNRMLMPIVTEQKSSWGSSWTDYAFPAYGAARALFGGGDDTKRYLFEAPYMPDGTSVEMNVSYEDVPLNVRMRLAGIVGGDPDAVTDQYEKALQGVLSVEEIPTEFRNALELRLEQELGTKPSAAQIVAEYTNFILSR